MEPDTSRRDAAQASLGVQATGRLLAAGRRPLANLVAPLVVALLAFALYLRTLLPGIAFGDWGEMQTVPHVLGVAHPTGYPTYILIAWLAELVPIGSVAFRANALSAVFVAAALGVLTAVGQRLGVRPVVAAVSALAVGAIATVWAAATVAEVNPLHLLFAALLIHRAVVWEARRSPVDLVIGGLLLGLALGNHLLTLFVAPFLLLFVVWVGRRELLARPWWIAVPVVALALGLAVYAYIPLAAGLSPPLPYNHPVTFEAVRWLVTGEQFRGQFGGLLTAKSIDPLLTSLPDLWRLAAARATPIAPVVGLVGLAILVGRRPAFGLACWGILVSSVYVWGNYLQLEHYLLVPWLILGLGVAVALDAAAGLAERRLTPRLAWVPGAAAGLAGALFAIVLVTINLSTSDRSGDRSGEAYVDAVFDALPPDAAILSYWDASTPLWHGQLVEGRRPDVLIVDDTNIVYEGWGTRERRIDALICERPVFILRLRDEDLAPTRQAYQLSPALEVRVAAGEPTASASRPIHRVEESPGRCP